MNAGWRPKCFAQSTRRSATDVRELVSSAIDSICATGTGVKSATERTGPSDTTAASGTAR